MSIKGRVAVLLGGTSAEREVSLTTGGSITESLVKSGVDAVAVDTAGSWQQEMKDKDIKTAFIALHGRGGEDGTIQGALELMGIPYTGPGVLASALAMDKIQTKRVLEACDIPTAPYQVLGPEQHGDEVCMDLPVVVKPSREGSTIGISIVKEPGEVQPAIKEAASHDPWILVEKFVPGVELTVGVLNGEPLAVVQIVTADGFYDYKTKYVTGAEEYLVPAPIGDEETTRVRELARITAGALRCPGAVRIDFRGSGDELAVIEVNTIPGMTPTSLLPMSAKGVGMSFDELVLRMLETAGEGSK
jgi:D-alanine-D-alanine ligase